MRWIFEIFHLQELPRKTSIWIPIALELLELPDRFAILVPVLKRIIAGCIRICYESLLLGIRAHYCPRFLIKVEDLLMQAGIGVPCKDIAG